MPYASLPPGPVEIDSVHLRPRLRVTNSSPRESSSQAASLDVKSTARMPVFLLGRLTFVQRLPPSSEAISVLEPHANAAPPTASPENSDAFDAMRSVTTVN